MAGERRVNAEHDGLDAAALLAAGNPWWQGTGWRPAGSERRALGALRSLLLEGTPPPLVVIDGARQTGKSRLLDALVGALLDGGIAPRRLCRLPLEHGPLRWLGPERLADAWESLEPPTPTQRDCLLVDDLQLWTPAQQDTLAQFALSPGRVLVLAGIGLADCVARWRAIGLAVAHCRLDSLDFGGCLRAWGAGHDLPPAPQLLRALFDWTTPEFAALLPALERLRPAFEGYLARGGFPAAAFAADRSEAARQLREELVMRCLRWDAVTLHGIRNIAQLEAVLFRLMCSAGRQLDMPALCARLTIERPTVRHFLDLLDDLGLVRRITPLGYGDRVQRARPLVLPGDPALAAALLWRSGPAAPHQVQSALLVHLQRAYGARGGVVRFAMVGRQAPALMVSAGSSLLPFLLHWQDGPADPRTLAAFATLCAREGIARGYLVTRSASDVGPVPVGAAPSVALMRVPAPLLCLWLADAAPDPLEFSPRPADLRAR